MGLGMSEVVKLETLLTKEELILRKLDVVEYSPATKKELAGANKSKVVEMLSGVLMQEYIGDGLNIPIERLFSFQGKVFTKANNLVEACYE